jgi:asparagine synthase (glutamine-hydrolysing)
MCGIFGYLYPQGFSYEDDVNFIDKDEDEYEPYTPDDSRMLNAIKAGYKNNKRGPERTKTITMDDSILMFHRLSILNTSHTYDQPFVYSILDEDKNDMYYVLINGEIYNYIELCEKYNLVKQSNDSSIIFPLFKELNYDFHKLNNELNGEYALVIIKYSEDCLSHIWMSVDLCSVRPLFYVIDNENGVVAFSSLLIGLSSLNSVNKEKIRRLDGGEYISISFKDDKINTETHSQWKTDLNLRALTHPIETNDELYKTIVDTLEGAVITRLQSDRPIGCLLSGGVDSSLVASIAARELKKRGKKLRTFSIGMEGGTDLKYAKMVADHIDSEHTEIIFDQLEALKSLKDVIHTCETYDITTIRASTAQYLLAKWISENTDIKVILNGDGADECQMGYLYYHLAPSSIEAHKDSMKLIDNIHYFDGLRVDRNLSSWGLEARVPFLDKNFVELYKQICPSAKRPGNGKIEKYLIRKAFDDYRHNILPLEVLWRVKESLSDGISKKEKSWYLIVQEYISKTKSETIAKITVNKNYEHLRPISNESTWYREVFEKEFGKEVVRVIPYFWMPNWSNTNDPAQRTLNIYDKLNQQSNQ